MSLTVVAPQGPLYFTIERVSNHHAFIQNRPNPHHFWQGFRLPKI